MTRSRIRTLLVALSVALTVLALVPGASSAAERRARLIRHADAIPGRYIVVLEPSASRVGATGLSASLAADHGGTVLRRYTHALNGYAARMTPAQALETSRDPRVAYVEQDAIVTADATQSPVTWGLDRIDQRSRPLSGSYTYGTDGTGVTAYVLDTGIRFAHVGFGGRAVSGFDAINVGTPADDCDGHGTHVAGTIGSATYGVAKNVGLVAVRVLDCSGSGSIAQVVAGIDWVIADHGAGEPAVANMSLGGSASTSIDNAVVNAIADGVTFAVAAGNEGSNACNGSPSRVPAALTVGATADNDRAPWWSNYGSCVDLFAPGVSITSTSNAGNTATEVMSGTSMATPHVVGVAALYLSANPTATPSAVASAIVGGATPSVVRNAGGSPNLLLFEPAGGSAPPGSISLTATPKVVTSGWKIVLKWSGAAGVNVDVERNASVVYGTPNDGKQGDKLGAVSGTFAYRICQTGSSTCSNAVSVTL